MRIKKTVAESLKALEQVSFTNLKRKLQEAYPEGKGWSPEQCEEAEKWYRRFLSLRVLEPQLTVVPNGPIDGFWHGHILDTRAYMQDCEAVFGEMLHHYPYFGLNGDGNERDNCFDLTNAAYERHWGENCTQMAGFEDHSPKSCHPMPEGESKVLVGAGCNHAGSGTGCGQRRSVLVGAGCNHSGSGTGCGQGCGGK